MFEHPWFLLLLVLVPALAWLRWRRDRDASIDFSSVAGEWEIRPTWRQRVSWLPSALGLLALTLMIVSLARPRYGREQTVVSSEGIAIEMVVDRSSSMQALDFQIDGNHVDRLTAIKNVAARFILGEDDPDGDDTLTGRASDLIGLIPFAGYADALTPPTLDHSFLVAQLNNVHIADSQREDGTAIGDAISLAVDKLNSLDAGQREEVKSKVIILLTDGENTAGEIDPAAAAELAKVMGVKIYTIGVGTKGRAPFPVRRMRSGQTMVQYVDVNIDEDTLRSIASETGGKYFRAVDTDSLQAIYNEIDLLEKTNVETEQFVDYREVAVQGARFGAWQLPALLWLALGMLAAGIVLRHTLLRRFG